MPTTLGITASNIVPPPPFDLLTEATPTLWLDASDSSTITYSSGNIVSQWSDKSGNGNHATQATLSNRPTTSVNSTISKQVVSFTQTANQWLSTNAIPPSNFSLYLVHMSFSANAGQAPISFSRNSGRQSGIIIQSNSGMQPFPGATKPYYTNQFSIIEYISPNSTTTSELQLKAMWPEGYTSYAGVNQGASGSFVSPLYLGRRDVGPTYMSCDIAEVIMSPALHDNLKRERIEGYLAWKWNITSCLPSTHRYKFSSP